MPETLTDTQRSTLASRFKLEFLPRMDMTAMRADEKVMEVNHKQAELAVKIVKWFEREIVDVKESGA